MIGLVEAGRTGGVGAIGCRLVEEALRRAGISVESLQLGRHQGRQLDLWRGHPTAWFVSILHVRQMWDIPLLFRDLGIPLFRADRRERDPLVVFGGAAMINPMPVAPFADLICLGDGEVTAVEVGRYVERGQSKRAILEAFTGRAGFWAPGEDREGRLVRVEGGERVPVLRCRTRTVVEIARGCLGRCAFCALGWAGGSYRPIDVEAVPWPQLRGRTVNLYAPDIADTASVRLDELVRQHQIRRSSVDASVRGLLRFLRAGGAPLQRYYVGVEGMSERLRLACGKPIANEELIELSERLRRHGSWLLWYVIGGLPGETDADRDGFERLIEQLDSRHMAPELSLNPFNALPHTPLQWEPNPADSSVVALRERLVARRRSRFVVGDRTAIVRQTSCAASCRADRTLHRGGEEMAEMIARVDGRRAQFERFDDATLGPRPIGAPLPWDRVDVGISRDVVLRARERYWRCLARPSPAIGAQSAPDCIAG